MIVVAVRRMIKLVVVIVSNQVLTDYFPFFTPRSGINEFLPYRAARKSRQNRTNIIKRSTDKTSKC